MQTNARREPRRTAWATYSLRWQDQDGQRKITEVWSTDRSASGIRVSCPHPIPPGTVLYLQARGQGLAGSCVVRHCTKHGRSYWIGLELGDDAKATASECGGPEINYYEFLQINPTAEQAAIQRVYRMLASRFHPDNPDTGDVEKFLILQAAHETLCDPERRAAYDASLRLAEPAMDSIFQLSEFVIGVEGEVNRRLGVLSLLYNKRRISPESPGILIYDLEKRIGMAREHLEFTVWYLKSKQYIAMSDNSELTLTATGVDYLEANATNIPMLQRLLQSGPLTAMSPTSRHNSDAPPAVSPQLVIAPGAGNGNS